MDTEFTPIFLFILVGILVAIGMLGASAVLNPGRGRTSPTKLMPYESGMDPIGDARQRFDVRYYLVAIAFLVFDVELLFLYPWAVAQWSYGVPEVAAGPSAPAPATGQATTIPFEFGIPPAFRTLAFLGALGFIVLVVAGFAYDWRKGVFEWR